MEGTWKKEISVFQSRRFHISMTSAIYLISSRQAALKRIWTIMHPNFKLHFGTIYGTDWKFVAKQQNCFASGWKCLLSCSNKTEKHTKLYNDWGGLRKSKICQHFGRCQYVSIVVVDGIFANRNKKICNGISNYRASQSAHWRKVPQAKHK